MKNQEIINLFNKGYSNIEIAKELNLCNVLVFKTIKALGLVRTPEHAFLIKSKAAKKYEKATKLKFKKESSIYTYESKTKNYVLDHITKGLINSGNLENDIELAVASIQKLRENFAKIPKFETR